MQTTFVGSRVAVQARSAKASRSSVKAQASSRVDKCDKNGVMVSPSILSANFSRLGEEVSDDSQFRSHQGPDRSPLVVLTALISK